MGLIPLYACIFLLIPDAGLRLNDHDSGLISSLYFSVITITTLGYGDITPVGSVSQLLTASESILGITLIGLFLNSLSHHHGLEVQAGERKKQLEKEEKYAKTRFTAFNQLINKTIDRYVLYTIPVMTPISNRELNVVNESFTFNDMQDLFKATACMTDDHFRPAIEYYFESLKELTSSLEDLVKHGYVQRWHELESLCIKFIVMSKNLDFSDYILGRPNIRDEEQILSDSDVEKIRNHEGEVKFILGHSMNPYVALNFQIHQGFKFVRTYRQLAVEITNG